MKVCLFRFEQVPSIGLRYGLYTAFIYPRGPRYLATNAHSFTTPSNGRNGDHAFNLSLARSSCASLIRKLFCISLADVKGMEETQLTHLYHQTVGTTVPKCHKL